MAKKVSLRLMRMASKSSCRTDSPRFLDKFSFLKVRSSTTGRENQITRGPSLHIARQLLKLTRWCSEALTCPSLKTLAPEAPWHLKPSHIQVRDCRLDCPGPHFVHVQLPDLHLRVLAQSKDHLMAPVCKVSEVRFRGSQWVSL